MAVSSGPAVSTVNTVSTSAAVGGTEGSTPVVRVLGIRHHGPGSARAVAAVLEEMAPDAVLIEGPAEADALVALVGDAAMTPPVALLAYAADDPSRAAFWPFAVFSPEWQALTWAVRHEVPVRFCDLPAAMVLTDDPATETAPAGESATPNPGDGPTGQAGVATAGEPDGAASSLSTSDDVSDADGAAEAAPEQLRYDPIGALAAAAGYDDPERWWDDVVESRMDGPDPFDAITEAMAELRAAAPPLPADEQAREERREAHMRTVLRRTIKDGHRRIAVVCGAWHAPALSGPLPKASADTAVLRGLPRRKVQTTWVPWTHGRLATASGYGAGVASPGWYHHLFTARDRTVTRWLAAVAGVLRDEDLPVSSAHLIEAVRLAETLAVLRGRPLAGLAEVTEATRAVLCDGDEVLLDLVVRRLVVGEALGAVPDETPTVPLESDLRAVGRRLRLRREPTTRTLDLDLRKPIDLDRSRLLHRLRLLGIDWGMPARSATRNVGTFRESWTLLWRPEFAVAVVEASMWGTSLEAAAVAKVTAGVSGEDDDATGLAELTGLVETCLLADLPVVLPALLSTLDSRAARDTDVGHLMEALPALVRALRYGDVRGTDTSSLAHIADALLARIRAGLPAALQGLGDDTAAQLRDQVNAVHAAVATRDDPPGRERWLDTLSGLADRTDVHGLVTGRFVRLLLDAGRLERTDAAARLARALSLGTPVPAKAAWIEGFLAGGGLLLVHDAELLALLDAWLSGLGHTDFVDVLPLLRRTFGGFEAAERRGIGEQVRREGRAPGSSDATGIATAEIDEARATAATRVVATLLGVAP